MDFQRIIAVFDGEHAESARGVSNSLGAPDGIAELILKVYLSMESKIGGFPTENAGFRW